MPAPKVTEQRLWRSVGFDTSMSIITLVSSPLKSIKIKVFQPRLLVPLKVNLKFPVLENLLSWYFFKWLKIMVMLNESNPLPSFRKY